MTTEQEKRKAQGRDYLSPEYIKRILRDHAKVVQRKTGGNPIDLVAHVFTDIFFDGAELDAAKFTGCDFVGCSFTGTSMNAIVFKNCTFTKTLLLRTELRGARFINCTFVDVNMAGVIVDAGTGFDRCNIPDEYLPHLDGALVNGVQTMQEAA